MISEKKLFNKIIEKIIKQKRGVIILFFLFILFNLNIRNIFSQNQIDDSSLYFSFRKNDNYLIIAIEGFLIYNGKKIFLKDLIYEWKINLGDNYEKIKTYQPYLSLNDIGDNLSGVLSLSGKRFDLNLEKFFSFHNKKQPKVVIAKYNKKYNLALPLTNLKPEENILYPLVYNFSSKNLSYVWSVNNSQYYNSYLLDISSLSGEIKINLRVFNLDNQNEFAFDEVIIRK